MKIDLKPHQEAYLRRLVDSGAYTSLEDALDSVIPPTAPDDTWMRRYVDEALVEVAGNKTAPWSVEDLRTELHERHPELKPGADR